MQMNCRNYNHITRISSKAPQRFQHHQTTDDHAVQGLPLAQKTKVLRWFQHGKVPLHHVGIDRFSWTLAIAGGGPGVPKKKGQFEE